MNYNKKAKISQNLTIFIALLISFSAVIYYFYKLTYPGIILSIILSIISLIIFNKYQLLTVEDHEQASIKYSPENKKLLKPKTIIIVYVILLMAAFLELIDSRSGRPLISPWEVVNIRFFWLYGLSTLTLIFSVTRKNISRQTKILMMSVHYFLSLSIAVIVYRIAYGFDPFIHQAAMEIISQQGFIVPKTPYYLGQYGLVVTIHKLFGFSIYILNKFLVPLAASLLLPGALYNLFSKLRLNKNQTEAPIFLGSIFILIMSLPLFIVSTPQNFSYIFIILALISGLTKKKPTATLIFSLTATAIHPLAGIPALIWSAWLIFKNHEEKLKLKTKKIISGIILSGGAILIPLALFISSGGKLKNFNFNFYTSQEILKNIFSLRSAGNETWLLNLIYFIFYNYRFLIFSLIIAGLIIFYKNKKLKILEDKYHLWQGIISINISLIVAFLLSSQISFNELIVYEQAGYSKRILTIIVIFFLPFIALSLGSLIKRIVLTKSIGNQIIWLIVGIVFSLSSLYCAYPRFDKYFNSRGYSTSNFDLEAVQKIDNQATGDYIVLANQQVSAGALHLLGFNHYFKTDTEDIYFYPIPTGGTLYQYYLDMVYKEPSRETMLKAMDLANTNEAYFVINKYWNESGKIIAAAKINADNWEIIGDKEVFIFQYKR